MEMSFWDVLYMLYWEENLPIHLLLISAKKEGVLYTLNM